MTQYRVRFIPAHRNENNRKRWEYTRDEFLAEIAHIKHGKYGVYMAVKYGDKYELLHTEYTRNLPHAKRIARDFVTS